MGKFRINHFFVLTAFTVAINCAFGLAASASTIYYSTQGTIYRVDTEMREPVRVIETFTAGSLAIDAIGARVYWSGGAPLPSPSDHGIGSARLDGGDLQTIPADTVSADRVGIAIDQLARKIYWTSPTRFIRRANLDGSNAENVVPGGAIDIDVDPIGRKLYWTAGGSSGISVFRANYDGTSIEEVLPTQLAGELGVALDLVHGKIYVAGANIGLSGRLISANLDGSNEQLLISGLEQPQNDSPTYIDVDPVAGKVYFANGVLQRTNLDGSFLETVFSATRDPSEPNIDWFAIGPAPVPEPATLTLAVLAIAALLAGRLLPTKRLIRRGIDELSPGPVRV